MIAVHQYFKGCHTEEQLELFYTLPRGETKTNKWKTFKETDFNSVKNKTF